MMSWYSPLQAMLSLMLSNNLLPMPQAELPIPHAIPGGVVTINLGAAKAPNAQLHGKPVAVIWQKNIQQWQAVVGIGLQQAPGMLHITVDGQSYPIQVRAYPYPEQRLTVQKQHVSPSDEQLQRIAREQQSMRQVYTHYRTSTEPLPQFAWPVAGRMSSHFGLRRFFNGEERAPHSGLDIAAPTGTPVMAPAPGVVVLRGDFFFNGNSVFLDHGHGLITMYCHLHSISVKEGDILNTGDQLGTIGTTGRSTGPHLHWTASLNNARINPLLFVPIGQSLAHKEQP